MKLSNTNITTSKFNNALALLNNFVALEKKKTISTTTF